MLSQNQGLSFKATLNVTLISVTNSIDCPQCEPFVAHLHGFTDVWTHRFLLLLQLMQVIDMFDSRLSSR